jgi:hypothetical protein
MNNIFCLREYYKYMYIHTCMYLFLPSMAANHQQPFNLNLNHSCCNRTVVHGDMYIPVYVPNSCIEWIDFHIFTYAGVWINMYESPSVWVLVLVYYVSFFHLLLFYSRYSWPDQTGTWPILDLTLWYSPRRTSVGSCLLFSSFNYGYFLLL